MFITFATPAAWHSGKRAIRKTKKTTRIPDFNPAFVAAFLASSGVNVIVKGEEAFGEDTICELPLLAAFAIKRGLDRTGALRANTLNVPDVLGVADRIGHIELGKDADLVVFAGDPFHYRTVVKSVFIDGISVNEYRQ